jgi:DNA-binding XRE family transcriptional regulator
MAGQPINLAEKILLARRRLREEQPDFGKRFDVKRWMVNQWEKGKVIPKPEHLAKLTQLFKELFDDDEGQVESVTYQLFLPFDEPVKLDFRISPYSETKVGLAMQVKRKAG